MTDTPRAVLEKLVERWNAHDLDGAYGLLDPGYREYFNGSLLKEGSSGARAADQFMYDAVPDYRREVDDLYADDQGGAMRWRFLGTGSKGAFELSLVSFCRIAGGKITEARIYGDATSLAQALGVGE